MEHQLRPPRGFVDIFNPFSLKNLESHTVLSELGMDILNTLQVKSSEKVLRFTIWSTVNGATLCFKSEICVASG
jgi:hypothetical protein